MSNNDKKLLKTGSWSENDSWELYATADLPSPELCTAVMCVAISPEGKIVLTRTQRGWGMLGGHVEDGESLEDTIYREAYEEGGFVVDRCQPFAVRKIVARTKHPTKNYPFPISYMVYYWATTKEVLQAPTGAEVLESAPFTVDEVVALNIPDQTEIELGYRLCRDYEASSIKTATS